MFLNLKFCFVCFYLISLRFCESSFTAQNITLTNFDFPGFLASFNGSVKSEVEFYSDQLEELVKVRRRLEELVAVFNSTSLRDIEKDLAGLLAAVSSLIAPASNGSNLYNVKRFVYGPKGIAYSVPPKHYAYKNFKNFFPLFAGLLGDIEKIIVNSFVSVFKLLVSVFLDSLEDTLRFVLNVLYKLLPAFSDLIDFVVEFILKIVEFLEQLYVILDQKTYLTEGLIVVGVFYFYFRDVVLSLFVLFLFVCVFGIKKL